MCINAGPTYVQSVVKYLEKTVFLMNFRQKMPHGKISEQTKLSFFTQCIECPKGKTEIDAKLKT